MWQTGGPDVMLRIAGVGYFGRKPRDICIWELAGQLSKIISLSEIVEKGSGRSQSNPDVCAMAIRIRLNAGTSNHGYGGFGTQ